MSGRRGHGASTPAAREAVAPQQTGTVGLFVSILVRYPEVASVTYRSETRSVRLTFLVRGSLADGETARFRSLVDKSIRAHATLRRRRIRLFRVDSKVSGEVSVLEIERDVDSLTQGEFSLVLSLAGQFFGENLVVDRSPEIENDELAAQEELIEEMLEDLRESPREPNLIAFREEGRVLVFNQ